MITNTVFISSASCKCGQLFDPTAPFSSTDQAVKAWEKYLRCKANKGQLAERPRLTIHYLDAITDTLKLPLYDTISFVKSTELPNNVFLRVVIDINSNVPPSYFKDTQFDGPTFVEDYATNAASQSGPLAMSRGQRANTFNQASRMAADFFQHSRQSTEPTFNRLNHSIVFSGVNIFTRRSQLRIYGDRINIPTADVNPSPFVPGGLLNEGVPLKGGGDNSTDLPDSPDLPTTPNLPGDGSCVPSNVSYLRSTVISANSIFDLQGGLLVYAPGQNIISFTNLGVASIALTSLRAAALIVIDNFDRGVIDNGPFGTALMEVTQPQYSALFVRSAGTVAIRQLRIDFFPGAAAVGIVNPDAPNTLQGQSTRKGDCKDDCRYDSTNNCNAMYLVQDCHSCEEPEGPRGDRLKQFVIPATVPATNGIAEVSNSVFRNHNPAAPVYLSNFRSITSSYNNLINVKHFGINHYSNNLGAIFSLDSDASLITNGSTFLLPRIIRSNYTHTRLDGTSFAVDAGGCGHSEHGHSGDRESIGLKASTSFKSSNKESGSYLKESSRAGESCSRPHQESLTINLPGDIAWNGRVIIYTRIDNNCDAKVKVQTDGKLQGHCNKVLYIKPFNTYILQNIIGDWRILDKYGPD